MKYLLSFLLLFSVAAAQSLPQQYAALDSETRLQYDQIARQVKPRLDAIDFALRSLARNEALKIEARLTKLGQAQTQLDIWVGDSVLKYTIMLPLLHTVQAQRETLAARLPLRVPYQDHQIAAQFNVSGAQPYALGLGNVTLVRGRTQRGEFGVGDKVMVYFKQRGPQLTSVKEIISNSGDSTEVFLLADDIPSGDFLGGAALFIPQP